VREGEAVLVARCSGRRQARTDGIANSGERLGVRWRELRAGKSKAKGGEGERRGAAGEVVGASARAGGGDRAPSGRRRRHALATWRAAFAAVGTAVRASGRETARRVGLGRGGRTGPRKRAGERAVRWRARESWVGLACASGPEVRRRPTR
jgi:hypothetical protein